MNDHDESTADVDPAGAQGVQARPRPVTLIATLTPKPEYVEELFARTLDMVDKCRAEPETIVYHVHRKRENPDVMVVYETYYGGAGLRAHQAFDYIARLIDDLPRLLAKDIEVTVLDPLTDLAGPV